MGYPHLMSEFETLRDTVQYMFGMGAVRALMAAHGEEFLARGVGALAQMLRFAIAESDVVGLPTPGFFARAPTAHTITGQLGFAGALLYGAPTQPGADIKLYVDTFIFKHLYAGGRFDRLLRGLPYLGIVAHTDLAPRLQQRFGIGVCETTLIPGHQSFMASERVHFPAEYEAIAARIPVPFRGAPVLVAAGYLGKFYCALVKRRGGVALDIGSVFDGWSGKGRTDSVADVHMRL